MKKVCATKYCKKIFECDENYLHNICQKCLQETERTLWAEKKYENDKVPEGMRETFHIRENNASQKRFN